MRPALLSAFILVLCLQQTVSAAGKPIQVQTVASQGAAAPGESGFSVAASALIIVSVTDAKGLPLSTLGPSTGTGASVITLPAGWTLDIATAPAFGSLFQPTQFSNLGDGVYVIRVAQLAMGANWDVGDYTYLVKFSSPARNGQALGKLTIAP